MKTKSLIINRRNILRNQIEELTNELLDGFEKGTFEPETIKTKRHDLNILHAQINEIDWVLEQQK
jgi:hypothetical protein